MYQKYSVCPAEGEKLHVFIQIPSLSQQLYIELWMQISRLVVWENSVLEDSFSVEFISVSVISAPQDLEAKKVVFLQIRSPQVQRSRP